jgi:ubiquinone/menaquinone biosynthesis C-methylase UbiE
VSGFDELASSYDRGRSGYSNSVYDELIAFGARPESHVLDVGCGTGLASAPLLAAGFAVTGVDLSESMLEKARERMPDARWIEGDACALPFAQRTFDVAISAQTFHWLDRVRALAEMTRVLAPGGVVGIWWKNFTAGEPLARLRKAVADEMGVELPTPTMVGGFREFYAAPFTQRTLRVLPWQMVMPQARYLDYERSRLSLRKALGDRHADFVKRLGARIAAMYGGDSAPLSYIQYLYLGKT